MAAAGAGCLWPDEPGLLALDGVDGTRRLEILRLRAVFPHSRIARRLLAVPRKPVYPWPLSDMGNWMVRVSKTAGAFRQPDLWTFWPGNQRSHAEALGCHRRHTVSPPNASFAAILK